MPASEPPAGPALRAIAGLSVLLLAGLALVPQPASAWEDDRETAPHRVRHHHHARPVAPPDRPPPAIVSGYLPRNNNLPMYNEPPRRGPAW